MKRLKELIETSRAVDAFCIAYLFLLSALACVAPNPVRRWWLIALANIVAVAITAASRRLALGSTSGGWRFALGTVPLLLFVWLWA